MCPSSIRQRYLGASPREYEVQRLASDLLSWAKMAAAKTTFIKLLCRLYDHKGQILLNGIDIRKYRYDDYIKHLLRGVPRLSSL